MPLEGRWLTDAADLRRLERLNATSPHGSVFSAPSWHNYQRQDYRAIGIFKGQELCAGVIVPVAGGRVLPVVQGTPWTGITARSTDEGENLEHARCVAEMLRREFGEATLTMSPEWTDVRGFLWDDWRAHVRYTYRGRYPKLDKRVRRYHHPEFRWETVHNGPDWNHARATHEDTTVDMLRDSGCCYYWAANEGGSWHAEMVADIFRHAYCWPSEVDLVGCNSPARALFKRGFGLPAVPYYFVTTGDPAEVREFWRAAA